MDKEQINQLGYLPPKIGVYGDQYQKKNVGIGGLRTWVYETDDKGNRIKVAYEDKEKRELPAKWQGLCTATQKCYDLTDAFVEQNFSPGFREQVMKIGSFGKKLFVNVPPGANKVHDTITLFKRDAPDVKYIQKEGERYCLPYSIASALHHLGAAQLALEIYRMSMSIVDRRNTMQIFLQTLRTHSKPLQFKKLQVSKWNIFANGDKDLVVTLLRGSDLSEDHCITIYGQWIFDSNLPKGLPLCRESLDLCVSSDGSQLHFDTVREAYMCMNYMCWIGNKNKKNKKKKGNSKK